MSRCVVITRKGYNVMSIHPHPDSPDAIVRDAAGNLVPADDQSPPTMELPTEEEQTPMPTAAVKTAPAPKKPAKAPAPTGAIRVGDVVYFVMDSGPTGKDRAALVLEASTDGSYDVLIFLTPDDVAAYSIGPTLTRTATEGRETGNVHTR